MGCLHSKDGRASMYAIAGEDESAGAQTKACPPSKAKEPSGVAITAGSGNAIATPARPKLDPKDFRYVDCKNEVKIKSPGTINGQSFKIDNCEGCDIYVLDYCAQVTIDDCKACRIFIGPTDGSVFIRNCTGCTLATVCRQLRTRDCRSCRIALHCRTKPVVEESSGMGFACLDLAYPQLSEHMRLAKLGPFHNFWWNIFDFTPREGNWHLLPAATTTSSLLEPLPQEVKEVFAGGEATDAQSPLLKTRGAPHPLPEGASYLFVAFQPDRGDQAAQLASSAAEQGWLLRTNKVRLNTALAGTLAEEAGWGKAVARSLSSGAGSGPGGGCVGLELSVPAAEAAGLRSRAEQLGGLVSDDEAAGRTFRGLGIDG